MIPNEFLGEERAVDVSDLPLPHILEGAWDVHFPHGWGAPSRTTFPELTSWSESIDEGIRYFSGIATYHKSFDIPEEALGEHRRVVLDLGTVHEVAEVWLNGQQLGIAWHAPYALDVTGAIRAGTNHLVIEVANVLNNRLVGDARLPERYRRTKSNVKRLPTAWRTPMAEASLLPSGLLGPVQLRFGEHIGLNPSN